MSPFTDKTVLITGASSGIGRDLARVLADRGANLVLTARRTDRLESLAAEIEASGRRAIAVGCDVNVDGDLERAVAAAHEALGPIDVAIANAGFGISDRIDSMTLDDFRRQFETNVFGVLRTIFATLPDLKSRRGRLVLVGSVAGHVSAPLSAPYSMSKFAVRALSEALRVELRRDGVTVTLISPGFVASEIRMVDNQGVYKETRKDPIPAWLVMPGPKAARQIARAIARGRREAIITGHGKFIVWLARHFPGPVAWLVARKAPVDSPAHRPPRPPMTGSEVID